MSVLPNPLLVGMVHLPARPGSPACRSTFDQILVHSVADADTLPDAGSKTVLAESFGDAPFHPDSLEPVTVAATAVVVREPVRVSGLLVGVNCLRNDARSVIGIAACTVASVTRVKVRTGVAAVG